MSEKEETRHKAEVCLCFNTEGCIQEETAKQIFKELRTKITKRINYFEKEIQINKDYQNLNSSMFLFHKRDILLRIRGDIDDMKAKHCGGKK